MRILTAGDKKFRPFIELTVERARAFGYNLDVYDLGDLGLGSPHAIGPLPQREEWPVMARKGLHKPAVLMRSLASGSGPICYLDGDAILVQRVDDVATGDFDVGVTVRRQWEIDAISKLDDERLRRLRGYINAGVIFLSDTPAARGFVERWADLTHQLNSDQYALNQLAAPWRGRTRRPALGSTCTREGIRFRYFRADEFNNFYVWDEKSFRRGRKRARIFHFRGGRAREAAAQILRLLKSGECPG